MDVFEIIDPSFRSLVLPNAELLTLGEHFAWLEGPVWFPDRDELLVSDLPNDSVWRWSQQGGLSIYKRPSGFANGHARDKEGRLISCHHQRRCITRVELDGRETLLVDQFEGRRLNGPNDVVVRSDGSIWFTDPLYGISTDYEGGKAASELPPRVYRFDPAANTLSVVSSEFQGPNGLAFSPDERLLYIAESGPQFAADPERHISVFDVSKDDRLMNGRVFHKVSPGYADGFRCDEDGRIWTGAGDGVHCLSLDGQLLGKILTGGPVSNLCFGGRNRSQLFLCASHKLMAIYTNVRGALSL